MPTPDDTRSDDAGPDDAMEVSVEVVLRPGGRTPDDEDLTAERIGSLGVDPDVVERLRGWFAERGFDARPSGPMSVSVTGPLSRFETTFRLGVSARRRLGAPPTPGAPEVRLRRDVLPAGLRGDVEAIVRPAAPDFGPGAP